MTDLLAEVDDAMRRERFEKLWKEHGKTILTAIAILIIGTGLNSAYRHWDNSVRSKQTDTLITLLDETGFPQNIVDKDLDLRPGLRGVALLTGAGALMDDGKTDEALALYNRAAADKSIPDDLRHLAVLMSVRLQSDKEDANINDLLKNLEDVASSKNSPWRFQAYLESAALYANKNQDYAKARVQLNQIQEAKNLPDTLYAKARALDHVYAILQQKAEKTDAKKETDKQS